MARRVQWVFRTSAADRGPHSWTEHEALLRAIEAGDEDHALALASAHVAAARASYREHLDATAARGPQDGTADGVPASPR
jgi:DNA-binding FadR family transcriptional regulator